MSYSLSVRERAAPGYISGVQLTSGTVISSLGCQPAGKNKVSKEGMQIHVCSVSLSNIHTFDGDHHPIGALTTPHMQMNIKFRNQIWLILSQEIGSRVRDFVIARGGMTLAYS